MQCRLTDYQIDYTMQKDYNGAEYVARIIGLPFSVGKRYIIHLFNGNLILFLIPVHFVNVF